MKGIVAFLAGSAALIGSPMAAASEAYLIPDAATPWVFSGVVDVSKGLALTCNVELVIHGPNDGADTFPAFDHTDLDNASATITLWGGSFGLCSLITVAPLRPGDISYVRTSDTAGTITFHNVYATTITPGDCYGDIMASWDQSLGELTVVTAIPGVSGPVCNMTGLLQLVDPIPGDVRHELDSDHDPHQNL